MEEREKKEQKKQLPKFKEKSEKEILKMSKEEQIAYWEDVSNHYKQVKKAVQEKIRKAESEENKTLKKKTDHATFILFGYLIKQNSVKDLIRSFSTSYKKYDKETQKDGLTETDIEDLNLLMKSRNLNITF